MNVLILGGFLGSGKTSILFQLARYIAFNSNPEAVGIQGEKIIPTNKIKSHISVAILENEIGETGIDDKLLRANGYTVENMFAGCACCTMAGELTVAVHKIREDLNPDWLLIESTGVAYPLKMRENMKAVLGTDARICIITDAKRWKRLLLPMGSVLVGQLSDADTILMNKIDLVSAEQLQEIDASIQTYNATAARIPVSAIGEVNGNVWDQVLGMDIRERQAQ